MTRNGFIALNLTSEHLKHCVNTSKVDKKPCYPSKVSVLILIKKLSNQQYRNSPFPSITTLESVKRKFW